MIIDIFYWYTLTITDSYGRVSLGSVEGLLSDISCGQYETGDCDKKIYKRIINNEE